MKKLTIKYLIHKENNKKTLKNKAKHQQHRNPQIKTKTQKSGKIPGSTALGISSFVSVNVLLPSLNLFIDSLNSLHFT